MAGEKKLIAVQPSTSRSDYQRIEVRGVSFDVGFIDPVKALDLGEQLASTGETRQRGIETLLSNTFIVEGEDRRFLGLKNIRARLVGKIKTLRDLVVAATKIQLEGFEDGPSDAPPQSDLAVEAGVDGE